jgi:DNA-binding protein H-NS
MRKPRDFDAELRALEDKATNLKERRVRRLGELVAATGADALDAETLAGGLLAMMEATDPARKESWRKRGQAFFQGRPRDAGRAAQSPVACAAASEGNAASA